LKHISWEWNTCISWGSYLTITFSKRYLALFILTWNM